MKHARLKLKKYLNPAEPPIAGDEIRDEIKVGHQICLKTDDITILVRVKEITGNQYLGTIDSFENYIKEFYRGYKQGDSVEFTYDKIFERITV